MGRDVYPPHSEERRTPQISVRALEGTVTSRSPLSLFAAFAIAYSVFSPIDPHDPHVDRGLSSFLVLSILNSRMHMVTPVLPLHSRPVYT